MFGKKKTSQETAYDMVLLKTTSTNYEYALLKQLLKDNEIPYLPRERGSGSYMRICTGGSVYGTDFMVARSDYEKAKEIVDSIPWEGTQPEG